MASPTLKDVIAKGLEAGLPHEELQQLPTMYWERVMKPLPVGASGRMNLQDFLVANADDVYRAHHEGRGPQDPAPMVPGAKASSVGRSPLKYGVFPVSVTEDGAMAPAEGVDSSFLQDVGLATTVAAPPLALAGKSAAIGGPAAAKLATDFWTPYAIGRPLVSGGKMLAQRALMKALGPEWRVAPKLWEGSAGAAPDSVTTWLAKRLGLEKPGVQGPPLPPGGATPKPTASATPSPSQWEGLHGWEGLPQAPLRSIQTTGTAATGSAMPPQLQAVMQDLWRAAVERTMRSGGLPVPASPQVIRGTRIPSQAIPLPGGTPALPPMRTVPQPGSPMAPPSALPGASSTALPPGLRPHPSIPQPGSPLTPPNALPGSPSTALPSGPAPYPQLPASSMRRPDSAIPLPKGSERALETRTLLDILKDWF